MKLSMCRICFVEDVRMQFIVDSHLQEMYESLTVMPFQTEDNRPLLVCYICCAKLKNCYQLRKLCLRSEELFTKMLNSNVLVPAELGKISPTHRLKVTEVTHLSMGHVEQKLADCIVKLEAPGVTDDVQGKEEDTDVFKDEPFEEDAIETQEGPQSLFVDDLLVPDVREEPSDVPANAHIPEKLTPALAKNSEDLTPETLEENDEPKISETRRPRMRGLRRDRGVRVRGGRGSPRGSSPVTEVLDMVVVADRGSPSRRGRGRGGRVNDRHERPGPRTIDELVICDIDALPEGRGLETALHPKRMRMCQPSNPAPPPPPTLPSSSSSPSVATPSPASCSVPSPAMFVKRRDQQSVLSSLSASPIQHPSPPRRRRGGPRRPQHLRDEDITSFINHGSDEDSDESADEAENIAVPVIPRVFRSMMITPLDHDAAGDQVPAADNVPAGGLEAADVPQITTEQPWGLHNFDWRAFPNPPIPPVSRRETFSELNVGPTTPSADPYDIFIEIWDRQIMEHIASETNKYAQQVASQMFENYNLCPRSRISRWHDVTADELYVYFGIILAMGIVVKTRMEEYWGSTPDIFYTPGFSAHMSIDRFLILSKCLHFNDNDDMCALELDYSEARLFKIKPILQHLNKKFQEMYTPAQNIALDESLLMWKGSLEFCQLIPNKAANRGIKTYEICESQTGYLWRFEVHAHKKSPPQQFEDPLEASTPAIVLQLIQGLEHKGYTLWMDNFYQSPCLARRLKCLGFDCVGTLRTDRKFVPQALNSLTKQDMRPGQITGLTSGDVDVMVWRDNNRVAMISTYHGNGQQTVQGSTKPILILDYNIMMGGVDKKDQLLAMYPVERKRTKVWYKKFFRRLLNISVLNSYIIHHHTSSLSHRNFRINLVKSLLSKHSTPPPIPPATTQNKVNVTHRLAEFPMGKHQRIRRTCTACKKQVRTFCVGCGKTVCMDPCFLTIHS